MTHAPNPFSPSISPTSYVGLGAGAVFAVLSQERGRDAADLCVDAADGVLCPAAAEASLEANRQDAMFADIGFGVGALAIGGGIYVASRPATGRGTALGLTVHLVR